MAKELSFQERFKDRIGTLGKQGIMGVKNDGNFISEGISNYPSQGYGGEFSGTFGVGVEANYLLQQQQANIYNGMGQMYQNNQNRGQARGYEHNHNENDFTTDVKSKNDKRSQEVKNKESAKLINDLKPSNETKDKEKDTNQNTENSGLKRGDSLKNSNKKAESRTISNSGQSIINSSNKAPSILNNQQSMPIQQGVQSYMNYPNYPPGNYQQPQQYISNPYQMEMYNNQFMYQNNQGQMPLPMYFTNNPNPNMYYYQGGVTPSSGYPYQNNYQPINWGNSNPYGVPKPVKLFDTQQNYTSNELPLINSNQDRNMTKRERDKKRAQSSKGRQIEEISILNQNNNPNNLSRYSSSNQRDRELNNSKTASGYKNYTNYGNEIYKPYTLKEYKEINNQKIVLGSLGPNLGTEEWEKRQEKLKKQEEYSKNIKMTNKAILNKTKETPTEVEEKLKKEKTMNSKVHKASEYAKQIGQKEKGKDVVFSGGNININVNNYNISENNHYSNYTSVVQTGDRSVKESGRKMSQQKEEIQNSYADNSSSMGYNSSHAMRKKGSANTRTRLEGDRPPLPQNSVNDTTLNSNYNPNNQTYNNSSMIQNKKGINSNYNPASLYEKSDDVKELEKNRENYLREVEEIKKYLLK